LKGGFLEIPKILSFQLDVLVRLAREEFLGMTDPGWHAQHRKAALCGYATPSCFVAGTFLGYYYVGISMLGDAFRDLLHPRLRTLVTMSVRGGNAYECVQHG
jgi:hypothetical protein